MFYHFQTNSFSCHHCTVSCMMLKQTKCCNSHLCIHHKDCEGEGRGSANIWEILQVFLPSYLLQNCTINKHPMRNINLIFCCDISIHWNATFVLINNPPKSFIYGLEFFNVCPTNYLVFSRDSWNHSSSSNFIRHKTCNRSADFGNHNTLQEVCPGLKNSSICAYNNIF